MDIVSHTTYIVGFNLSGGTYSLKSTPSDRFFERLFVAILFALRVFARNVLRGSHRGNIFFIFSFLMNILGFEPWPYDV